MKRQIWQIIIVLGLFFIAGGIGAVLEAISVFAEVVGYGVWYLLKFLPHLPTSYFDFISDIIEASWSLTQIAWLDTFLFNLATFAPSVATFLISKLGFKLNSGLALLISLFILGVVLQLFTSWIFWIVLGALIITTIVLGIIYSKRTS